MKTIIEDLHQYREQTQKQKECKHLVNHCHNYMLTCKNCEYKRPMGMDLKIRDRKVLEKKRLGRQIYEYTFVNE